MSGVEITGNIKPLNGGAFTVFNGNPVPNLAALALLRGGETGTQVWVQDQAEFYQLDVANTFTLFSPLIIAGAGGGRWFRKSKAHVVGNFTLWCQSYSIGIVGFTPGQLLVTGATEPDIVLTIAGLSALGAVQTIIVDNIGNLWLSANDGTFTSIQITKYLLKDCLQSGALVAAVTLNVPTIGSTEGGFSVFDRHGGLWTCNSTHGGAGLFNAVRYGQKAYSLSGGLPSISLAGMSVAGNTQDMIFDGSGNLWGTGAGSGDPAGVNGSIFMFTADQIQNGGSGVAPAVYWHGTNVTGVGLGSTCNMAMAPNGYLWVTDTTNSPYRLRAWDTKTPVSGNPAPAVILTCASFSGPYSLTFDRSGNLWVQNGFDNRLQRIPAASLAASGAVVADIIITPAVATLTSVITFPNNPDRSGVLPSGAPIAL